MDTTHASSTTFANSHDPITMSQNTASEPHKAPRGQRKIVRKAEVKDTATSKRSQILAKNRHAADRYRLRQKDYVKNLERRSRTELEKRMALAKLVESLKQEVQQLKNVLTMQSACNCSYILESRAVGVWSDEFASDPTGSLVSLGTIW